VFDAGNVDVGTCSGCSPGTGCCRGASGRAACHRSGIFSRLTPAATN